MPAGLRVCAVDWEMAGLGCELLDVAALVAGGWTKEQQIAIALEYFERTGGAAGKWQDERQFFRTLDFCRLYTACGGLDGRTIGPRRPPTRTIGWMRRYRLAKD